MTDVQIHRTADLKKLKNPLIIVGLPGTGLVGSVAASHIVDALDMSFGGYISSSEFAPLAAIHEYKPMPAARIHFSQKENIVVIISEMTIPVSSSLDVADKLYEFAKSLNASSIISLGGISLHEGKQVVYIVSSDPDMVKRASKEKIAKPIREGATTGVTGVLLTKGTLENFPITTLLAESSEEFLDPKAASIAVKALSKIIKMPIKTTRLEKEAEEISEEIKESVIKAKISKKGPMAEEGGTMYG